MHCFPRIVPGTKMTSRIGYFGSLAFALILLVLIGGCERVQDVPASAPPQPVAGDRVAAPAVLEPTPPEVLDKIRSLGGTYQLNAQQRVAVLSFHRCKLNDGDLEILRSTPDVWTLNLRGGSVVGGELTAAGLQPLRSLANLRRLDLSYNSRFSGRLDVVRELSNIEFLDLRSTQFGDEAMESVARLPRLQTLLVGMGQISETGVRALRGSPLEEFNYRRGNREDVGVLGGLKNLRTWHIGFGFVTVDRLVAFDGMDQLQNLWITGHGVDCPDDSVRALRTMKSLATLQISSPADGDCRILAALDSLPNLKMLRLTSIGDRGLERLPHLPSLEYLDLTLNTQVSAEGLRVLRRLPSLRHLALRPSQTTAEGLAIVAECTQLETLVFHPNRIRHTKGHLPHSARGDAEPPPAFVAADLRPILQQTAIRRLDVDGLGFGDEVLAVTALGQHLETLNVSGLPITDEGLVHLRHLKNLKLLDVAGTEVTFAAAESLQSEHLPHCHITDNWCCGCLALRPR